MLDSDGPEGHNGATPMPNAMLKPYDDKDDAGVGAELEQMKQHAQAAQQAALKGEREAILGQLQNRDTSAAAERQALAGYLDELRSRDDEAGDAVRAPQFASDVEQRVAQEQQLSRAADGKGAGAGDVAQIIQHINDPATFEALLEVQRLDEALAGAMSSRPSSAQQREPGAQGGRGGGGGGGGGGVLANGKPRAGALRPNSQPRGKPSQPPPLLPLPAHSQPQSRNASRQQPQPQPQSKLLRNQNESSASSLRGTPRSTPRGDGTFLTTTEGEDQISAADAVSALAAEIEKLKGIEGGAGAGGGRRGAKGGAADAEGEAEADWRPGLVVGGRRKVAGIWISLEDEARMDALLGADAALSEVERLAADAADDAALARLSCPDGEGYRPAAEEATRLHEIEDALAQMGADDPSLAGLDEAISRQLRALPMPFPDPPQLAPDLSASTGQLNTASSTTGTGTGTGAGASSGAGAASEPGHGTGGHTEHFDDYLGENKQHRENTVRLERVRDRLSELNRIPSSAPPTGPEEQQQLADLLACVRQAAEHRLDAGQAAAAASSTPRVTTVSSLSRPGTATALPPPPPSTTRADFVGADSAEQPAQID